jgi:hypothetical protein
MPEVAKEARAVLTWMRGRLPGAVEMVYDNYNFLVIGFSPTERPSDAVFSVVLAPRWISICFIRGAKLSDPDKLLRGAGNQVRNIRLAGVETLNEPGVRALIDQAVDRSPVSFDPSKRRQLVIRAVVAKQRPRRPQ